MQPDSSSEQMKTVLLSFDLEEFDMPHEYQHPISFEEQLSVSQKGTTIILDSLARFDIKSTFFCTSTFALHSKEHIERISSGNHELASHGYFHSQFNESHLLQSKTCLEELSGQTVLGFRMPRMQPVNLSAIAAAGYSYDSSLNPVYLPGRYNNFFKPRTLFNSNNLWQIPASATPVLRIPLFWLSFHHFNLWFYKLLCMRALTSCNYLNLYFHPWEFIDLGDKYGLPRLVTKNTGMQMIQRFEQMLDWMVGQGFSFSTMNEFIKKHEMKTKGETT